MPAVTKRIRAMTAIEPAQPRGSLFRKYLAYLVALVSTALLLSGAVGFYYTYEESKTQLLDLQREKAKGAASRIESYIRETGRQLQWVSAPQAGPLVPVQRQT